MAVETLQGQIAEVEGVPIVVMGEPKVHLIARTQFLVDPEDEEQMKELGINVWNALGTAEDAELLCEFAGRNCYVSWKNLGKKTNEQYIAHLRSVGHGSVFEHPTWTFYIWRVSRGYTHEQVRHRPGWAYSQLSTRYVDTLLKSTWERLCVLEPAVIANNPEAHSIWLEAVTQSIRAYDRLTDLLGAKGFEWIDTSTLDGRTLLRKNIRQAARSVLPIGIESRIVVTGNARSWRHFIDMRGSKAADVEIRSVAIAVLKVLKEEAPNLFGDYVIEKAEDGTEIAKSPYSISSQPELIDLARIVGDNLRYLPEEARSRVEEILRDIGAEALTDETSSL
jgi:thymidylate synthase (FAD)